MLPELTVKAFRCSLLQKAAPPWNNPAFLGSLEAPCRLPGTCLTTPAVPGSSLVPAAQHMAVLGQALGNGAIASPMLTWEYLGLNPGR